MFRRPTSHLPYPECTECQAAVTANLVGACASVGIEEKKSTVQMLREYLYAFHRRGHVNTKQSALTTPDTNITG